MIGKIINGGDGSRDQLLLPEDFLGDFALDFNLMEVPSIPITIPSKYAKLLTGTTQISLSSDDWNFIGTVYEKRTNHKSGTCTVNLTHIVGLLDKKNLPTNVTFKDSTVQEVVKKVKEYWKDAKNDLVNLMKFEFVDKVERKIEYEFSQETVLQFLTKLCEKTQDMQWRIDKKDPFKVTFSAMGAKKEVMISPETYLIDLGEVQESFQGVMNSAVVRSDKADAGASSLTLRDIFHDKKLMIEGFPVIKTDRPVNSQRHFDYPPLPVFATDMSEDEYAILDEEGIALEAGELYWGSITTNDTQAIAGENKEVSDEDRIKATVQMYKSAIRKMRASRRKVIYPVTTSPLPAGVQVGDKVKFVLGVDLVELTPCSKYYTKVLRANDWFYVNKMSYQYSTGNSLVLSLELSKFLSVDREVT